jgi:pimeloyl-ACP methyl ester carboxylesterase
MNSKRAGAVIGIVAFVASFATQAAVAAQAAPRRVAAAVCKERSVVVSRAAGIPAAAWPATIAGTLCVPRRARAVQLLVHGATYNRSYWNFDLEPETYSYVRAANLRGIATFAVDVVGTGASTHPLSGEVNYTNTVWQLHQVVQWLRGRNGGPGFSQIVWVGHSFGSMYALAEAALFHDVDAIALTGYGHQPRLAFVRDAFTTSGPAEADLDPGYRTSGPGMRSQFYNPASADPAVIAHDDATKDVATATQMPTGVAVSVSPVSRAIDVPVLLAIGEFDNIYCQPPGTTANLLAPSDGLPCGIPEAFARAEAPYYSKAACVRTIVIPSAGHSFNLHRNAPVAFDQILDWSMAALPTVGGHHCPPARLRG